MKSNSEINLADDTKTEISTEVLGSNAFFISVWRQFAESFQNADIATRDGLEIGWPDVPLSMYNNIFLVGNIEDTEILAARVHEATSFARTKRQAGVVTVCHELLGDQAQFEVDAIFESEGYIPAFPLTGMAGNILPLAAPGHPDLRIERAEDNGVDVTEINCRAYGFSVETGRASLLRSSFWQGAFPYVAFSGDRAVATATVVVQRECLYLALVATVPEAQGKGYAQAVVRHALQKAHEATGLTRTILHATQAGYPLYDGLRYRVSAHFTCYAPRPTQ
jgi:GNAT superfamily N-acetyltransferase